MDRLRVEDLAPSMRLDESLHLTSGELVLYRRQAVDELVLDALAASGVKELALVSDPSEVDALALDAGRQAATLGEISERTVFTWGLYEVTGRKVLSARRRLTAHRAWVLASAGVDVLLEPASDLAAKVARRRRFLLRRRAPRPGRGPVSIVPRTAGGGGAVGKGSGPSVGPPHEPPASGEGARITLALAMLASEAETLIKGLAVGLSLDVPWTLDAARCAVVDTFARPFASAASAVEMLASGRLRERAAARAVIAVAAARAAGWREDDCLELAAGALLCEAPYSWLDEARSVSPADRTSGPCGPAPADRTFGPCGPAPEVTAALARRPVRAHMLLADADGLAPEVALTVLQVEERPDGSGRPFGLTAPEILPGARILAATDEFCRAVSPGVEGRAVSGHEAVKRCIELAGGGLLDGDAVRAFLRAVGFYPVGSSVRLSTGEIARVVATSDIYERPVVIVTRGVGGLPPPERRVMDLSRLRGIRIEGAMLER